jgi:hypothetical protein
MQAISTIKRIETKLCNDTKGDYTATELRAKLEVAGFICLTVGEEYTVKQVTVEEPKEDATND